MAIERGFGTAVEAGPIFITVSDGDKGDIVISNDGANWTIPSTVLSGAGRNLINDTTVEAQRNTLGLGSLATLSSINNDNWSGTDLSVNNGGTGASDASGARTNLGLGSMATQSADAVAITGGTIDNAVFNGKTVFDSDGSLELNRQGTGDRASLIDFHSSGLPGVVDYDARLVKNTGANGSFYITNVGTGELALLQTNAAPIIFYTNGTERLRIASDGTTSINNLVNASSFGITSGNSYGGTVTQLTSRTTAVTINKISGAITMFTAVGSATAATFIVNNTTVSANDVVIVSQKSGSNLYDLFVTAVNNNSFNITFRTTGGAASDAPVINFVVIKSSIN